MSSKEGGPPPGATPPDHPKDALKPTPGAETKSAREARLAAALRDNLRRRKAARRAMKTDVATTNVATTDKAED